MPTQSTIDRRTFLVDMGRGAFAVAIVTLAGCSPSAIASFVASPQPQPSAGSSPGGAPTPTRAPGSRPPAASGPPASVPPGGVAWTRVNLGFVSAYLLVRSGEAALVDTGVAGSADAIEASLRGLGLDWADVGHVVITHLHDDHQGSIRTVVERAPDAALYAGVADLPSMLVDDVQGVGDGDKVFDLQIVSTPGHTRGSISVLDPVAGVLVAGDAMGTSNGSPILPQPAFTVDMAEAKRSIVKLGGLQFETLLVGHGNPVTSGASALVAQLGAAG